jgi:hypothetical protein
MQNIFNKHKRKDRQDDHDSEQRSAKHKKHNVSSLTHLSAHAYSLFRVIMIEDLGGHPHLKGPTQIW